MKTTDHEGCISIRVIMDALEENGLIVESVRPERLSDHGPIDPGRRNYRTGAYVLVVRDARADEFLRKDTLR